MTHNVKINTKYLGNVLATYCNFLLALMHKLDPPLGSQSTPGEISQLHVRRREINSLTILGVNSGNLVPISSSTSPGPIYTAPEVTHGSSKLCFEAAVYSLLNFLSIYLTVLDLSIVFFIAQYI